MYFKVITIDKSNLKWGNSQFLSCSHFLLGYTWSLMSLTRSVVTSSLRHLFETQSHSQMWPGRGLVREPHVHHGSSWIIHEILLATYKLPRGFLGGVTVCSRVSYSALSHINKLVISWNCVWTQFFLLSTLPQLEWRLYGLLSSYPWDKAHHNLHFQVFLRRMDSNSIIMLLTNVIFRTDSGSQRKLTKEILHVDKMYKL